MNYQNVIMIEPGKRGGKPCIRGMRITVYDVLSYLVSGMTYEEVLADFPYLTREDILACLSYVVDREWQNLIVEICGTQVCLGGCSPIFTHIRRTRVNCERFIFRVTTVARPVGSNPIISVASSFHSK